MIFTAKHLKQHKSLNAHGSIRRYWHLAASSHYGECYAVVPFFAFAYSLFHTYITVIWELLNSMFSVCLVSCRTLDEKVKFSPFNY